MPRKQWVVVVSDDLHIRVYNYNTMELVKKWVGHNDYIRSVAVHASLPYFITSADDLYIKMWDWENDFSLVRVFEGHNHYVMQVVFNPKDPNTFASASLDTTIKIWNINSSTPNLTLEGHKAPANCVDYYHGGDNPYVVSGADDRVVKVWDLQTKTCIKTLTGHMNNVTCVAFHPELPIIVSGSEDGSLKIWNSTTYRLEKSLNYGWDRAWSLSCIKGSNNLAAGFDDGTIMLKLGTDVPAASMDQTGKVIFCKYNVLMSYNCATTLKDSVEDGQPLNMIAKELGTAEFSPVNVRHNYNGRFIVANNDSEYVIYTALQVRAKKFGSCVEFVWDKSGGYAIQESSGQIRIFDKNFDEPATLKPDFSSDALFGGQLLGIRGNGFICFYDWSTRKLIRKIDVTTKLVYWNDAGDNVAIVADGSFYILKYNKDTVSAILESGGIIPDDGIDDAFEVLHEIPEKVRTATWVGDCFVFNTAQNIVKYCVGSKTDIIGHLEHTMYLLGYLPKFGRIVLMDKKFNLVTYALKLSVINFQSAITKGDLKTAGALLKEIPETEKTRVAQFLDMQGYKEKALEITRDPDHQFDLAVQLQKFDMAYELALKSDHELKWRLLSDLALKNLDFKMAEECMWRSNDLSALLILFTSSGDSKGLQTLAVKARESAKFNIAFICYWTLKDIQSCIDLLVKTGRIAEAAFMARTYAPSQVTNIVKEWKEDLKKFNPRKAESLADPEKYPNLFPGLQEAMEQEKLRRGESLNKDIQEVPQGNDEQIQKPDDSIVEENILEESESSDTLPTEEPVDEISVPEEPSNEISTPSDSFEKEDVEETTQDETLPSEEIEETFTQESNTDENMNETHQDDDLEEEEEFDF